MSAAPLTMATRPEPAAGAGEDGTTPMTARPACKDTIAPGDRRATGSDKGRPVDSEVASVSGSAGALVAHAEHIQALAEKLKASSGYACGALRRYEASGAQLYLAVADLEMRAALRRCEALAEALRAFIDGDAR